MLFITRYDVIFVPLAHVCIRKGSVVVVVDVDAQADAVPGVTLKPTAMFKRMRACKSNLTSNKNPKP